jgi:hypothetical protein
VHFAGLPRFSDLLISGCELKAVVFSYSSPIPTCNDGTGRGPLHPKRPRISRCGNGQLPLQILKDPFRASVR